MSRPDEKFLHLIADAADRETLPRFRTDLAIDEKVKVGERFDPVTEADRESERAIRALIKETFPEHAILGEEFGSETGNEVCWVIDPIDGTRPYVLGIPVWGTLIGVTVNGRAEFGLMSQPVTNERFWALDGQSWMKSAAHPRRLMRTSGVTDLAQASLHVNSPDGPARNRDLDFASLDQAVRLTRYGGECYAFAMLAAGRLDLCLETSLQPYDIVAMIPIIENAGGVVTTLDGERAENGGRILASANREIHEKALELLMGRR